MPEGWPLSARITGVTSAGGPCFLSRARSSLAWRRSSRSSSDSGSRLRLLSTRTMFMPVTAVTMSGHGKWP